MKICWVIFGVLVGLVAIVVSPLGRLLSLPGDIGNFVAPIGIIGAVLIVSAALTKMKRVLKIFMILTGSTALLWPASLYLHNILFRFFPTEPVTYILFFYVSTLGFIFGAIGTIITGIVKRGG